MMSSAGLQPILVSSIGRSGTSLLMELLGTCEKIAMGRTPPFEERILTAMLVHSEGLARMDRTFLAMAANVSNGASIAFGDLDHGAYLNPPGAPSLHRELFDGTWAACSRRMTQAHQAMFGLLPTHYAEKMPEPFWHLLKYRFREVKVIIPIRDPRDQWLSAESMSRRPGQQGLSPPLGPQGERLPGFEKSLPVMRHRLKLLASGPSRAVFPVSYERMVGDLEGLSRELSAWLGLALRPERIDADSAFARGHRTVSADRSTVERWRTEMSEPEQAWFRENLGDLLQAVGRSL